MKIDSCLCSWKNLQVVRLRYLIVLEDKIGKTSMGPCHGIAPEQWKQRRVFEGRKRQQRSFRRTRKMCARVHAGRQEALPMPKQMQSVPVLGKGHGLILLHFFGSARQAQSLLICRTSLASNPARSIRLSVCGYIRFVE